MRAVRIEDCVNEQVNSLGHGNEHQVSGSTTQGLFSKRCCLLFIGKVNHAICKKEHNEKRHEENQG